MTTQDANSIFHQEFRMTLLLEAVITPLPKVIPGWLLPSNKLQHWLRSVAFRRAFDRAYATFAHHYPEWVASLFDERFLLHNAPPLLDNYLRCSRLAQATQLAQAWNDQLGLADPAVSERRIAELVPVAADFLRWLGAEMQRQPTLRNLSHS